MEGRLWHLGVRLCYLYQSARLHTVRLLSGALADDPTHLSDVGACVFHIVLLLPLVKAFHVENNKT